MLDWSRRNDFKWHGGVHRTHSLPCGEFWLELRARGSSLKSAALGESEGFPPPVSTRNPPAHIDQFVLIPFLTGFAAQLRADDRFVIGRQNGRRWHRFLQGRSHFLYRPLVVKV